MEKEKKKFRSYRDESRKRYGTSEQSDLYLDQINCGSLMRIADVVEVISEDKQKLLNRVQYLERQNKYLSEKNESLWNRNRGLKSVITRQKNKMERMKEALKYAQTWSINEEVNAKITDALDGK